LLIFSFLVLRLNVGCTIWLNTQFFDEKDFQKKTTCGSGGQVTSL